MSENITPLPAVKGRFKSPFQAAAPLLRANRISIVPLFINSKKPAIEGWTRFCSSPADDQAFCQWMKGKHNIGACLGSASNLLGFDLDNDVEGLHAKIESILPSTPVAKVGAKGKTLFYQFDGQRSKGFSKDGIRVLDILSEGRQTVLPPSIHPDGISYRWLTEATLENTRTEMLPHISSNTIDEIATLFTATEQTKIYSLGKFYGDTKFEQAQEALNYISADDYDLWVRIGMCLKDEFGDQAFSIWDRWSQTSTKYNAREMRAKWASFNGIGLTIATLFKHARDAGYSSVYSFDSVVEDFELDGKITGAAIVEVKNDLEETQKPKSGPKFPERLFGAVTGLPQAIFQFIEETSNLPQPVLSLGASLCAAGVIQGHRIRTESDLRTNIYGLGIAPSGAGKDHARKVISRMLYDSGCIELQIGDPKSGAGLKTAIRNAEGTALLMWDEIGRTLKQISSRYAGSHEKDIINSMMKIFTSSSTYMPGDSYANRDGKTLSPGIDQPCFGMYGTSVPEHFYESLTGSDLADGFLGRILLFESRDYKVGRLQERPVLETPEELIELIKKWRCLPTNSSPKGNVDTRIIPAVVPCSEMAGNKLRDYDLDRKKTSVNTLFAPLWFRAGEHSQKLALIVSDGKEITGDNAQWAIDLTEHCVSHMVHAVKNHVSSNQYQANSKRILSFIRSKNRWVSTTEIGNKFDELRSYERNEILEALVEREILMADSQSTLGRRKVLYRFVSSKS